MLYLWSNWEINNHHYNLALDAQWCQNQPIFNVWFNPFNEYRISNGMDRGRFCHILCKYWIPNLNFCSRFLFSGQVWDTYQIKRITQILKNKLNTWRQQTLLDTCHASKMIMGCIRYRFQQVKNKPNMDDS